MLEDQAAMGRPHVDGPRDGRVRKDKARAAAPAGQKPRLGLPRKREVAGAAVLALLAYPIGDARADEYAAEYNWSDRTVEATDGNPGRRTRVRGPIRTQDDWAHAVTAVDFGATDITDAELHTAGNDAYGVYFSGAAGLSITGARITTRGDRAHGLGGFDQRGDDLPDWAYATGGELRMDSGTITLYGNRAHGLHVVGATGPIHLGAPMSQAHDTTPASAARPDAPVWIFGKGSHNTAIHVTANRNVTFNGVRTILNGPSSTGILATQNSTVTGKNLWLYSQGNDSAGLDVSGRSACAVKNGETRCDPASTTVRITRGFIHMQGANSPAVALQRARAHLSDVSLMTGPQTPYAVGNEAGRFRFEGKDTRATLKSYGTSLRAWADSPDESAVFSFKRAEVHSASNTLLEVVRLQGAAPQRPGQTYYTMLTLDDTLAEGDIHGMPQSRAHIQLANGSVWEGHTDIGGHVRIDGSSTWAMDGNSAIDAMAMADRATLRFVESHGRHDGAPRFHSLTVRDGLEGNGRFEMRTHLARGLADSLDIRGRAHGSYAVLITDHSLPGERAGARAVPIVRARQGDASFALENAGQAVDVLGHRYTLKKAETATGFVWSLETDDALPDAPADGGDPREQPGTGDTPGQADDGEDRGGSSDTTGAHTTPEDGETAHGDAPPDKAETEGKDGGDGATAIDAGGALAAALDKDGGDAAPAAQPSRAIRNALVNNGGIASASTLWTAAMRPVESRTRTLRATPMDALPAGKDTGIWIRGIDTRQHLHQADGEPYTESLWGYTLGADRAVDVTAGRWHLGVTASQVDAQRRFDDGKGRTSAALFGAYAVLRLDNGAYASVAASAGRYRNTVQARGSAFDDPATGRFHHVGAGIAIAAGHRLDLARGWFVEPHAGLSYFRAGPARYTLSDGTAVHDRGGHSLQSQAGVRAGRAIDLGNGDIATPYVRANWLREFANRGAIHADGASLGTDLSGNRFEIGLGAEAEVGRRHLLYADIEVGKGRHVSHSRAIVAGYRYRW